jgi:hypothetical protein
MSQFDPEPDIATWPMSEISAVAQQPSCDDIPTDFGYDLAPLEAHGIYGGTLCDR